MTELLPADLVSRLRQTAAAGYAGWDTARDAADEIERLRTIVRSVTRIISKNEPYKWKVERIVASLDGSAADVSVTTTEK